MPNLSLIQLLYALTPHLVESQTDAESLSKKSDPPVVPELFTASLKEALEEARKLRTFL